jgi:hypothetical protein
VEAPDFANERSVQLRGRTWHVWLRRAILVVLGAACVAALFGVFGQQTTRSTATTPRATFGIEAPPRLRGGLLFQARFTLTPRGHAVAHPKLVLNENWFDGMTRNGTTPQPSGENSRGGRFAMTFPAIGAGRTLTVLNDWQVDPTSNGRRSLVAAFYDGNTRLATLHRTLTIFP